MCPQGFPVPSSALPSPHTSVASPNQKPNFSEGEDEGVTEFYPRENLGWQPSLNLMSKTVADGILKSSVNIQGRG